MDVLNTIFLGIIAICMVVITAGIFVITVVMVGVLKTLKEILIELKIDYKVLSPKLHHIVENLEFTTSIFSILSIFKRRKKEK